MLLLTRLLVSV